MKSANTNIGHVTVITSTTPANLGKTFTWKRGKLSKKTAGAMTEGTFKVVQFDDQTAFMELLTSLTTSEALCHSVPKTHIEGRIVTKDAAAANPLHGQITRTKDNFEFKEQPGIMALDYDPADPQNALTQTQLWEQLTAICPSVKTAQAVWWCSGSSHIHGPAGELQGLRGQRLYLLVQDASDIERAGQVLADLCWFFGLGTIKISTCGSRLKRTLFDEAMHQVARLDFCGGAVCEPPLFQQRGQPVVMGGPDWLDTREAFPDHTRVKAASVKRLIAAAMEAAKPAAEAARASWLASKIADEAPRLQAERQITIDEARQLVREKYEAALGGSLMGDFVLQLADGNTVTVDEVLDNPNKWHLAKTLDPVEPEHRGGEDCGTLHLVGTFPHLYSYNNNATYRLIRQARRIECNVGDAAGNADALAQVLCGQNNLFLSMGEIVRADAGGFKPLSCHSDLQYQLEKAVTMYQQTEKGQKPMNIPGDLVGMTRAAIGVNAKQTPPTLTAITSLPYATADRQIVMEPGFNTRSGIYNTMVETPPALPETIRRQDLIEALKTIYAPWKDYQLATDHDRGAMLASIFTAVLRPAMRIAPGTFFDAPVRGSGKTKAALALGALMSGQHIGVYPFVAGGNEAELSKVFVALLRSPRRHLLIDNVKGLFTSAILEATSTSGKVSGRLLGFSRDDEYDARILMLATGNNAQLGTDLGTRYMVVRIDTGMVRPEEVRHTFEPDNVALKTRMNIACAVLTVLRAYWQSGNVTSHAGSRFAEWGELVRDPVIWLAQQDGLTQEAGIGTISDPQNAISKEDDDPETYALGQLLQGLAGKFGAGKAFYTKDVFGCLNIENGRIQHYVNAPDELAQIRESVEDMMSGRTLTVASIGKILQNRKGRAHECGLKLVASAQLTNGVRAWQVLPV